MIPVRPYKGKKDAEMEKKEITLLHLAEIRELELALCNGFNEIDLKIFNGNISGVDYNIYYKKMLSKFDYYYANDVYNSLYLKNVVFNPQSDEKYSYKEYMDIQKNIKRGILSLNPVEYIKIDTNINTDDIKAGQSGGKGHKILMKNALNLLGDNSNNVKYERENLDVWSLDKKIVVECGDTYARKLIGLINNAYEEIKGIKQFWILQNYNSEKYSRLYKFKLKEV